jgi:hypothetical protein
VGTWVGSGEGCKTEAEVDCYNNEDKKLNGFEAMNFETKGFYFGRGF